MRSGTENVAGCVGLAKALDLISHNKNNTAQKLNLLSQYLIRLIRKNIPGILFNGPENITSKVFQRLPNNVNFTIDKIGGEALILYLDSYGISASTASACSSDLLDPSHVLLAIGRSKNQAKGSIRFTLGKQTTKADIDYLIKVLPQVIKELRLVYSDK